MVDESLWLFVFSRYCDVVSIYYIYLVDDISLLIFS